MGGACVKILIVILFRSWLLFLGVCILNWLLSVTICVYNYM